MSKSVLMRAFLMLYASDFEHDDDRPAVTSSKSRSAERRAFTLLSSVCRSLHQTLTGWTVKHQLKKLIECEYTHFC